MADDLYYHLRRNPMVQLLGNVGATKYFHAVPSWKGDACLLCISAQIALNRVCCGHLGPWRVVPEEDLAFTRVSGASGLYVGSKGVCNLRPQRDLDPNTGLGTYNREPVSVPINVIEAQGKDVGGAPSITCCGDEDGEISLAQGPRSIDGSKNLLECRPGDSLWRPLYHLA